MDREHFGLLVVLALTGGMMFWFMNIDDARQRRGLDPIWIKGLTGFGLGICAVVAFLFFCHALTGYKLGALSRSFLDGTVLLGGLAGLSVAVLPRRSKRPPEPVDSWHRHHDEPPPAPILNRLHRTGDSIDAFMLAFTEILAAIVLIGFGVATFVGTYYAVQFMAPGRPLMSLPFEGLFAIFLSVCAGMSLIWQGLRGIVENIKPKPKAPPQSRPRNW